MKPKKSKMMLFSTVAAVFFLSYGASAGEDLGEDYSPVVVPKQTVTSQIQQGQSFQNILNIQERLAVLGYYPTYMVDGQHRKELLTAIKRFQKDYGLKVDGIFGSKTATMLNYYTGMQKMRPNLYGVTYTSYAPWHYRGF